MVVWKDLLYLALNILKLPHFFHTFFPHIDYSLYICKRKKVLTLWQKQSYLTQKRLFWRAIVI